MTQPAHRHDVARTGYPQGRLRAVWVVPSFKSLAHPLAHDSVSLPLSHEVTVTGPLRFSILSEFPPGSEPTPLYTLSMAQQIVAALSLMMVRAARCAFFISWSRWLARRLAAGMVSRSFDTYDSESALNAYEPAPADNSKLGLSLCRSLWSLLWSPLQVRNGRRL
jgi:hypothetical protein